MPSWKTTKKAYARFCRAADRADLCQICYLIRRYPEIHLYNGPHYAPIHVIQWNCPEFEESVLRVGLNPNSGVGSIIGTALHQAAAESDLVRVQLLLRFGADIEARNECGQTALTFAVLYEEMEAITFLLDAGADINSIEEDDSGKRITLLEAASRGDIETKYSNWTIYSYLRSRGAKTLAELEEQA